VRTPDHPATPRIAVLLAAYNGEAFISSQLVTLFGQTQVDVHLIARDDGSADGTVALLEACKAQHPDQVTLIADAFGPAGSAAANFFRLIDSVDADSFDYIAFSDQDDLWMPDKLSSAVNALRQSGASGYSSNLLAYDARTVRCWVVRKTQPQRKWDYLFQGASAGCTYVVTAQAIAEVQQALSGTDRTFRTTTSHDWAIYAICRSRGLGWILDEACHIIYRQHDANVYGAQSGLAGKFTRLKMFQSGWYREHVLRLKTTLAMTPFEAKVMAAISRRHLADRVWLAINAGQFRRTRQDRIVLRVAFLLGLF
jgi:rhamnosyltransferase